MKLYDISQEVFSCCVYPGDPAPKAEALRRMARGDSYDLSAFRMCVHNGTHVDAPAHFLPGGKTVDAIPPEQLVGMAYVAEHTGPVTAADAQAILVRAAGEVSGCEKRILLKGDALVTLPAAEAFGRAGVLVLGVESQSVGPEDAPMAVHKVLLGSGTVLLEGLRLKGVAPGGYLLNALPLNLRGLEGAPCRAILIEL